MNTLTEESYFEPPDVHWHECESCGVTFSHRRARLRGSGKAALAAAAHVCPGCGHDVNSVPRSLDQLGSRTVDWDDWYGAEFDPMAGPEPR